RRGNTRTVVSAATRTAKEVASRESRSPNIAISSFPSQTTEGGSAAFSTFSYLSNLERGLSLRPESKTVSADRRSDDTSSLDDPNEQNDDRDDQKDVDETADRVTGYQTQQPKHEQDYEDRPKHALLLSPQTAI